MDEKDKTFADLGIPFPLFEAPIRRAGRYLGLADCLICGGRDQHCFSTAWVVLPCPSCGSETEVPSIIHDIHCGACGSFVANSYSLQETGGIKVCYFCLREGRSSLGDKISERGIESMIEEDPSLADVRRRLLENQPGPEKLEDFELDWQGAFVSREHLAELKRTPDYLSWQGSDWLFCCKRPMTYLGNWEDIPHAKRRIARETNPADGGRGVPDFSVEWFWKGVPEGCPCIYAFECKACGRLRTTWDRS